LIKRYCERRFDKRNAPTIGLDYGSIRTNVRNGNESMSVHINFYDFSGTKDYLDVRNEFYLDVSGVLLVYDVGNQRSFDTLDMWLKEAKLNGMFKTPNVSIILCANKIDTLQRLVSQKTGAEYAKRNKFDAYFEVSAMDGTNVDAMFQSLFESALALK